MTTYRQRAFDLAQRLSIRAEIRRKSTDRKSLAEGRADRLADQLEETAKFLRQEIVIGPRTADALVILLSGGQPTKTEIDEALAEVGDIDDLVPF